MRRHRAFQGARSHPQDQLIHVLDEIVDRTLAQPMSRARSRVFSPATPLRRWPARILQRLAFNVLTTHTKLVSTLTRKIMLEQRSRSCASPQGARRAENARSGADIGCANGAVYNLVEDMDELILRVGSPP